MKKIHPSDWLPIDVHSLEPAAEAAVKEVSRNLLLRAGPGAGKTEVLAQRACFLLQTGACPAPKRILAISFKRDAAKNLKERVEKRCGKMMATRFYSMTYDAFGKSILDRFHRGLPDSWKPSSDYVVDFNLSKRYIMQEILENALGDPAVRGRYAPSTFERDHLIQESLNQYSDSVGRSVWRFLLKDQRKSSLSFGMINRLSELILAKNALILKALRQTYSFVFLDEFQDTTNVQYDLVKTAFLGSNSILTAVGDDKQRIMLWAGALENVFDRFIHDFVPLDRNLIRNYRSTKELVRIQHRIAQTINPGVPECSSMLNADKTQDVCNIYIAQDDTREAEYVGGKILEYMSADTLEPRDICIIMRQTPHKYIYKLMSYLDQNGVKSRIENDYQDLLKEPLCELMLSMLKLVVNKRSPQEWGVISDYMALNLELDRGRSKKIENELATFIKESRSAMSAVENWSKLEVRKQLQRIVKFLDIEKLKNVYRQYQQGSYLMDLLDQLSSNLADRLVSMGWVYAIEDFEGKSSIPIMTMHKSKGLEFHTVVFIGLEDQMLWGYQKNANEETCGFFVAFSRAKRRMVFSASMSRTENSGNTCQHSREQIKPLYDILESSGVQVIEI